MQDRGLRQASRVAGGGGSQLSLLVLGLDHRTAPVELRERLSVEREQLPDALRQLSEYVPQSAILSTCNRTEVYVYDPDDIGLVGPRRRLYDRLLRRARPPNWNATCTSCGKLIASPTCSASPAAWSP